MADDVAEDGSRDGTIKVTDKRMFTADGELREGFEHLREAAADPQPSAPESPPAAEPPASAPKAAPPAVEPPASGPEPPAAADGAWAETSDTPGALGEPAFLDLVGVLAEPIAIYMGDAKLPDGKSAENLDAARFYIDLLEVLRTKTSGNLTPQETSVLDDLLYQIRMRYVRKRG